MTPEISLTQAKYMLLGPDYHNGINSRIPSASVKSWGPQEDNNGVELPKILQALCPNFSYV